MSRLDIDRFFTLGPGMPFQANEVFTDREQHVAAYQGRVLDHCARSWRVEELMDFQRPARNVMAFVGEGGIGKSTLVRRLALLSMEGKLVPLPLERASVVVDFADVSNRSFETVLLRVRAALGRLGRSWSAFDIALSLYWERKHPGESLVTFLRKSSWIADTVDALRVSEQIISTVDRLLGGFGVAGIGYRLANLAGHAVARARTVKRLREDLPAFEALLTERDPDRMVGYLPALLAYDLEQIRTKDPVLAVCLLDTFENVQVLPAERRGLEDLVARLVYLMPNVFFIAASRRPLLWHDPVRSIGLTYGGELRWPGLAGLHGPNDQFPLDGFDETAAQTYLQERLTQDGQPVIPAQVRQRIIDGAGGSPHYLELSAGLFEQIAARDEDPQPEMFGRPFPELVLRVMRDLSAEDRELLRAAALLEAFDEEILSAVLPQARSRQIEEFLRRRFVRHDASVWPSYRLHENLRHGVTSCDDHTPDGWTVAERRRNVLRVTTYLEGIVLSIWNENQSFTLPEAERSRRTIVAFLLALYAAAEHGVLPAQLGHMAYTLHELGHWQVLASLPDHSDGASAELAQLVAVARLGARADLDVRPRYEQMKRAAGDLASGTYAAYACFELGNLAFCTGELDDADRYFTAIANEASALGAGALFGLAGIAIRQSRFGDHLAYTRKLSGARLEQTRVADTLGHLQMHNGRFEQAAELFTTTLEYARQAGAPLWVARATRHLALACMWFDPDRAFEVIPEARELNSSLGDGIGIAQCDMAAALSHAFCGEWADAERRLAEARSGFEAVGATFEMLPVDPVEALLHLGQGHIKEARSVARRLATATKTRRPLGPPVWSAITALWVDQPDWYHFDTIDWIEPSTARERWMAPLTRLRVIDHDEK